MIPKIEDELDIKLPKCHVCNNTKQEKSCFVDNNRISKINLNLGDFDYNALITSENSDK